MLWHFNSPVATSLPIEPLKVGVFLKSEATQHLVGLLRGGSQLFFLSRLAGPRGVSNETPADVHGIWVVWFGPGQTPGGPSSSIANCLCVGTQERDAEKLAGGIGGLVLMMLPGCSLYRYVDIFIFNSIVELQT